MRVLWVTNDLPPRAGGIEQFLGNLLDRVHPGQTVVVGPRGPEDAAEHDRTRRWRTVRMPGRVLPTPAVLGRVRRVAATHRPDVVVLGASWPLGELAGALRRDPGVPVVALAHGLEAGLASAGLGHLVSRATRDLAALTTISDWTEQRLAPHVRAERLRRLAPGVDVARFHPGVDGGDLRRAWGVPDDAVLVGCVSRLVARKGQDTLLRVWPRLRERHPGAWLALVGEGPDAGDLAAAATALGPDAGVVLPGRVSWERLPEAHAALDVFAMPCRTRRRGLDVEGLGIVYLEAQACGVPAVAGRSGGAPEAVRDGETGSVVEGRDPDALLEALSSWVADPGARRRAGERGRRWVERAWSWETKAADLTALLEEVAGRR
jgi:phosphatidyl-myo-inositol dimannoside synthase